MVQVLGNPQSPKFLESLLGSFGPAFQQTAENERERMLKQKLLGQEYEEKGRLQNQQREFENAAMAEENAALQSMGIPVQGIRDPKIRQKLLERHFEENPAPIDAEADRENFDTVKNLLGENAAKLWKASPTGARTALVQAMLEAKGRGLDLDQMLQGNKAPPAVSPETPVKEGELPEYKLDTTNMNPKEINDYRRQLRTDNKPLFEKVGERLKGSKKEKDRLEILSSISDKLPEGVWGKLKESINPATGEIIIGEWASPQVQRYLKTINDFTTTAKDSYGSRVTNFDLQQFMRRLPTLANSKEGRRLIIDQMKTFNEMDSLHDQALKKVYTKYGLGGITEEHAEELADKITGKRIDDLKNRLLTLEEESDRLAPNEEAHGRLTVFDQNGNEVGDIESSEVDQLPQGFTVK